MYLTEIDSMHFVWYKCLIQHIHNFVSVTEKKELSVGSITLKVSSLSIFDIPSPNSKFWNVCMFSFGGKNNGLESADFYA